MKSETAPNFRLDTGADVKKSCMDCVSLYDSEAPIGSHGPRMTCKKHLDVFFKVEDMFTIFFCICDDWNKE